MCMTWRTERRCGKHLTAHIFQCVHALCAGMHSCRIFQSPQHMNWPTFFMFTQVCQTEGVRTPLFDRVTEHPLGAPATLCNGTKLTFISVFAHKGNHIHFLLVRKRCTTLLCNALHIVLCVEDISAHVHHSCVCGQSGGDARIARSTEGTVFDMQNVYRAFR